MKKTSANNKGSLVIGNDLLEAVINPEVGASIEALRYNLNGQWVDIMRPTPESAVENRLPGEFSSFHLVPYSNRIEHGKLRFRGKEFQLKINHTDGHTIHGVGRDHPWKVDSHSPEELKVSLDSRNLEEVNWPFPFSSTITFSVKGNCFVMDISVRNEGEDTMPAGYGSHPYFSRRLKDKDENPIVQLPLKGLYPGDTPIPTGPWVELPEELDFSSPRTLDEDLFVDNCFRAYNGSSVVKWPGSRVLMTVEADEVYENLIFYTPLGKPYFAIEPVTNCNNGFNMAEKGIQDTGTLYLEPGEESRGEIRIFVDTY